MATFFANYLREYIVPGVQEVHHLSPYGPGRICASDRQGNLVCTDQQGGQLWDMPTNNSNIEWNGYHTVTMNGLLFLDGSNVIKMRTENNEIINYINTEKWLPFCIHASQINGDILVGLLWQNFARVNRYNSRKEKKQIIVLDNVDEYLYDLPCYITENKRGDVCVSDWYKNAVVVVKKSGNHRFSYKSGGVRPYGICTYDENHFLVCNQQNEKIDVVKHDYSRVIQKDTHPLNIRGDVVQRPRALWLDNENNLHVGQSQTNIVKVFEITRNQ